MARVDAPGIDRYVLSDRAGSHGSSRTEPSAVIDARIPESVARRIDASGMARSECVRIAPAYAAVI